MVKLVVVLRFVSRDAGAVIGTFYYERSVSPPAVSAKIVLGGILITLTAIPHLFFELFNFFATGFSYRFGMFQEFK